MCQLAIIAVFCATGMLACSATTGTHVKKSGYSRDIIYLGEIKEAKTANVYNLISNSRPHWLQPRGGNSVSYPVVYLDGFKYGGIRILATIATDHIWEIQFLNAADAFVRFGHNHPGGVILVTSN